MEVQQQSTGLWYSAEYWSFTIGDETNDQYRIKVDGYSGDAGDVMHVTINNGSYYLDGMMFKTYDHDNDPRHNCAVTYGDGWWYNTCHSVSLTSPGPHHVSYLLPGSEILSTSRMMIKPQQ